MGLCIPVGPRLPFFKSVHLNSENDEGGKMLALLLVLLLAAVLFGVGFTAHLLWIIAAIVLVVWLIGFVARAGRGARWYYW
jgi:hypothetical protein